ncbi:type II toxin-antitoxin system prevent-host-death family antitoxin [Verrucomicrobium spinosum]|uniref:type II toxin-antitoxin system prevent-host-death family antitoxin n=1 Tax=Verrucomicrobium spinosum TaxID=2736 RepID=UPI00017448A3
MTTVNLHELKAHLSEYARRVKSGETVVVCERNKPIGEFRPLPTAASRLRPAPGLFRGQIQVTDDFFLVNDELAASFEEGGAE